MRHLRIKILAWVLGVALSGCMLGPQPEPPDVTGDECDGPPAGRCDGDTGFDDGGSDEMGGCGCDPSLLDENGRCDHDGDGIEDPDDTYSGAAGEGGDWEQAVPSIEQVDAPFDPFDTLDSDGDSAEPTADPDDYYSGSDGRFDAGEDDEDDEDDDDDDFGDFIVITL
jgi:hypothetical protein